MAPLAPPEESDIASTDTNVTNDASWTTIGTAYPELRRVYTHAGHIDKPQVISFLQFRPGGPPTNI